ncbi:MAG: hypothetical protein K6E11_03130 [Bacilli bacterium]|nr:hypothetical protein [Bacilli bacterium]
MKNNKDFETFEESKKVSELFTFAEKENEKQFLSEDFVFKFEDNTQQAGADLNVDQSGIEDNDNSKELNEAKKEEELDKDKLKQEETSQASSSSTSASSASSSASATASTGGAVSTVAATVTTAAVLVVGGGLAIYGQTVDKPNICRFDEVAVVENTINFTLSIGNDQIKIDSGEENTECDVRVEIICPSMEDFYDEVPVSSFGKVTGEFTNLEYDTEYLLNVSQHVMLGVEKEYLMPESYSIKTPAKEVAPVEPVNVDGLTITKGLDPLGNAIYYGTLKWSKELPEYEYAYVGLAYADQFGEEPLIHADGNDDLEPDEGYEWIYVADMDITSSETQRLEFNEVIEPRKMVAAILIEGVNSDSPQQEYTRRILTKTVVDFETMEATEGVLSEDNFYFRRYTINQSLDHFEAYVAYSGDVSEYQYFTLVATCNDDQSGEEIQVIYTRLTNGINAVENNIIVSPDYEQYTGSTLLVKLFGIKADDPQGQGDPLMAKEIYFGNVPTIDTTVPIEPTFTSVTFERYTSNTNSFLYAHFEYDDPEEYWTYFDIEFTITNSSTGTSSTLESRFAPSPYDAAPNVYYMPDLSTEQTSTLFSNSQDDTILWTLTAVSSYPGDTDGNHTVAESVIFEYQENQQSVLASVEPWYQENQSSSTGFVATLTLSESDYLNGFDSISIDTVNVSDDSQTFTYPNITLGEAVTTDMPVAMNGYAYEITITGTKDGNPVTIFVETIGDFGIH